MASFPVGDGTTVELDNLRSDRDGQDPAESPPRSSEVDSEPSFVYIDGDVGGSGYNETKVDIVTVPCPGAHPLETWARDPLPPTFGIPTHKHFGIVPSMTGGNGTQSTAGNRQPSPSPPVWVRHGIRRSISTARVLVYRHRALSEGLTLDSLAQDLLEKVAGIREGTPERPLFFIAHSIGGLVVKVALLKASTSRLYRTISAHCYGITFFGTPHRGSSFLSMRSVKESIQNLLFLQQPLPDSLRLGLRLGSLDLLRIQDRFADIAGDIRVWTFYETIDSQISGTGEEKEVLFAAPLVSVKSALLGIKQERNFALESDHAHCASFGMGNFSSMTEYLEELLSLVKKAQVLSDSIAHTPLRLKDHVKVEVYGFFEDPDIDDAQIRLYSAKHPLSEFLRKGPERCLAERMTEVPGRKRRRQTEDIAEMEREGGIESLTIPPFSPDLIPVDLRAAYGAFSERTLPDTTGTSGSTRRISPRSSSPRDQARRPRARSLDGGSVRNADSHGASPNDLSMLPSGRAIPQTITAGFLRPNLTLRKYMWIHMPFTNTPWVKDIFKKLSETYRLNTAQIFNHENWGSKHVQGLHSESQPAFLVPSCSFISTDTAFARQPNSLVAGLPSDSRSREDIPSSSCLYLYLPYLHFDTYRNMIRRRNLIAQRLNQGRANPVPRGIANLQSLELRVIWEYLSADPPVHFRRSLDQFGYPSLRDTHARDDDQILYKLTKRRTKRPALADMPSRYLQLSSDLADAADSDDCLGIEDVADNIEDGTVLMVDQLWLWAIDSTSVVTFFPKRDSNPSEGNLFQQGDLRNSLYNELSGDLGGRSENALDLAAFIALHAVTVLIDRTSHPHLAIFRIFEEAIEMLSDHMTSNLKKFRLRAINNLLGDNIGWLDPDDASSDAIDQAPKKISVEERQKIELQKAERENRENITALLELRDMEDELSILLRLFDTQESLLRVMMTHYSREELKYQTLHGREYLAEALSRLEKYKQHVSDMLRRIDTIRGDYEKVLAMQAQVDDVHWQRLQTELASSQNLSVMIFTIFTVIFLPLSFFAGVFGMNTSDWQDQEPSLSFIGAISLPLSLVLTAGAFIAAFSTTVQQYFKQVGAMVAQTLPLLARKLPGRERRLIEKAHREQVRRREADRTYDFWATIRRQAHADYQIPETNRAQAGFEP